MNKDNLKRILTTSKYLMINEFESMKYSFFKEVSSFKKQRFKTYGSGASVVQTSSVIKATFVKAHHYNINRNQDSSINNKTTAENITHTITNTDVPPTSKENTKNKSNIENESNAICWESTEEDQLNENPKFKRKSLILGDSMIKQIHVK